MVQKSRETSGNTEGLAASSGMPSDASGNTSPSQNGEGKPVPFDLNATYVDPNDPSQVISGRDLKARVNRGLQADQIRSESDRAVDRAEKAEAANAEAQTRAEKLQAQLTTIDQEKLVNSLIAKAGLKDANDAGTDDNWLTGDPGTNATPATRDDLLQLMGQMKEGTKKEVLSEVRTEFQNERDKERATEESQARVNKFVERTYGATKETIQERVPDVPADKVSNVVKLMEQARQFYKLADDLAAQGELDKSDEAFARSTGAMLEGFTSGAEMTLEQRERAAQRLKDEQIATFSTGGPPPEQPVERKPIRNKAKAAEKAQELLQEARDKEAQLARIKNT